MKKLMLAAAALLGLVSLPLAAFAQAEDPAVIEASKSENGVLLYTTGSVASWTPFIEAFNQKYPWIRVEPLSLGGNEIWDRFYAESASGVRTADVISGGSPNKYIEAYHKGALLDYVPVGFDELPKVPDSVPGVTLISSDPQVMIWNKVKLPEELWPKGFTDLAQKVADNPDVFAGKVVTFDPIDSSVGPGMALAMSKVLGDRYWTAMKQLAPALRYESGGSVMLDKVTSGEYLVGIFLTSVLVVPKMTEARAKVVGWSYFDDATPFQVRSISIPEDTPNVHSAKLFTDFMVSLEGQQAYGQGGSTTFRPGVVAGNGVYTYQDAIATIGGEDKAAIYAYDPDFANFEIDFAPKLREALGR